MKSLVEELRAGAELEEAYDADGIIRTGYQPSLRWRAAAEIERLRGLLRYAVPSGDAPKDWYKRVREALGE